MANDYSSVDKLFHRLILNNKFVGELLFDIDSLVAGKVSETENPVFVTGLARAGTTVLMRELYKNGPFASLTYADMPLVLAPNLWAKLARLSPKRRHSKERAHGDGIEVDFDAPEAFEEVFWRCHCGTDYIRPGKLVPHSPSADVIEMFKTYQARVCHRYSETRYLAKNNNMMLRIDTVAHAMPDARILIAVRDPVAQALSLHRQHQRFLTSDKFERDYMSWLVHHEFGADHRPFCLPGQPPTTRDPLHPDYWISQWIACYGWLKDKIGNSAPNSRLVFYEQLCADVAEWEMISDFVDIPFVAATDFRPASVPEPSAEMDAALATQAREMYRSLAAP